MASQEQRYSTSRLEWEISEKQVLGNSWCGKCNRCGPISAVQDCHHTRRWRADGSKLCHRDSKDAHAHVCLLLPIPCWADISRQEFCGQDRLKNSHSWYQKIKGPGSDHLLLRTKHPGRVPNWCTRSVTLVWDSTFRPFQRRWSQMEVWSGETRQLSSVCYDLPSVCAARDTTGTVYRYQR